MKKPKPKVGDLVKLSTRQTRKGYPHEEQVGLVVDIRKTTGGLPEREWEFVVVDFSGTLLEFAPDRLRVVSEGR